MHKLFLSIGCFFVGILGAIFFSVPVQASAQGPVIYQVQTQGTNVAAQEYIAIKNLASQDVDVTNWCLVYASSTDVTQTILTCLTPPDAQTKLWLPAGYYFTIASTEFIAVHSGYIPQKIFNAGIAVAGGHIKLKDVSASIVDKVGWGTAVSPETIVAVAPGTGKILQRTGGDTDDNSLDFTQTTLTDIPTEGIYEQFIPIDLCLNIDGIQATIPDGYESLDGQNCTLIPLENATLLITELLPNKASTDTGNEFIEIYNPNDHSINLKNYKLELGPSFAKTYTFLDQTLPSQAYASFSDTQTGIVLPNTTASLRLRTPAGNIVNETNPYDTPGDDMAWANIDDVWQYTNQPTPGSANLKSLTGGSGGGSGSVDSLEPCPAGKYRNPETNRCKNIEDSTSSLTPCAADQVRNPATNRCRSVFSASSSGLTPCSAGQERNPATNRCRKIGSSSANSLKPCATNQERNPSTNRCRKKTSSATVAGSDIKDIESEVLADNGGWFLAGSASVGLVGYGVAEWRSEIASGLRRLGGLFGKNPPDA